MGAGSLRRVKRLARILGVIGGIGALVWAMRERLISVAISREPEPPAFRVSGQTPAPAGATGSITDVSGIGPVYATRLAAIGVDSLSDLADADPEEVAAGAQVPVSRARVWVAAAGELAGAASGSDSA